MFALPLYATAPSLPLSPANIRGHEWLPWQQHPPVKQWDIGWLIENNAASSLTLSFSLCPTLAQQQQPLTASSLSSADFASVYHADLLIVPPSKTIHAHHLFACSLVFKSTIRNLLPSPHCLSLIISPGDGCNPAQSSLKPVSLTELWNTRKHRNKAEREREWDGKPSPDFTNAGLLIWVWTALHLSQQERHEKVGGQNTQSQADHTHKIHPRIHKTWCASSWMQLHKLISTHKSTWSKSERTKHGNCWLCVTLKDKIAHCKYSALNSLNQILLLPT